ncbi:hypothetical protein HK103_001221 [Boothiomyces macroporosus]|uniref:Uncharacterized protein n=1 Tax=Boothiomyces macroporosus TaxID=261099 RepID=A0AAD5UM61_9FUNG|nr:hypothetical protein HK103_001221 [Boothiomyces macroporosus]
MLTLPLLFANSLQKNVLTAEWTIQDSCSSPPNAMYYYNLQSTNANTPPNGEIWPLGYSLQATERTLESGCLGITVKVPFVGACCASFVDQNARLSSSLTTAVDVNFAAAIPSTAKNQKYCYLQSISGQSVFGFRSAWFLADGSCSVSESVSCSQDGILSFFPNQNCQGTPKTFGLSSSPSSISYGNANNTQASLIVIDSATNTVGWLATVPVLMISPNFSNPVVPVILVILVGFFLGMVYGCYFLCREYMEKKTAYMLGLLISQISWTITVVTLTMSKFSQFSGPVFVGVGLWIVNIASVISVCTVTSFLMQFLGYEKRTTYIVYGVIIGCNLVMGFQNQVSWNRLDQLWLFGFAFWDCFPPLYVSLALLKINSDSLSKRCRKLAKYDPWFFVAMIAHFLNIAIYVLFVALREFTAMFRSDRNWVEYGNFVTVILVIHATLNIYLIIRLRMFVKKRSIFSNSGDRSIYTSPAFTSRISTNHGKESIVLSPISPSKAFHSRNETNSTGVVSTKWDPQNKRSSTFDSRVTFS